MAAASLKGATKMKSNQNQIKLVCVLVAAALVAGCAMPTPRAASARSEVINDDTTRILSNQKDATVKQSKANVGELVDFWLPVQPIVAAERDDPTPFDGQVVVLQSQYASLEDAAEKLAAVVGVPVRLATEVSSLPSIRQSIALDHTGEVAAALNKVAAKYGVSWRYANGAIQFFIIDTRVFFLNTAAGDVTSSTTLSGSSGGGGGGSSGGSSGGSGGSSSVSQSISTTATLSQWTSVQQTIQTAFLSPRGRVTVSAAGGTVTVSDTTEVLDRVERFIEATNRRLDTHVMFEVKVYSYSRTRTDDYGIDVNGVARALSGKYIVKAVSPYVGNAGGSSFSVTVPPGATGGAAQYVDSAAIIRALSQTGTVSNLYSTMLFTSNNQPVQYGRTRQIVYLARSGSTQTASVGSQSSLEPGTLRVGFTLNMTPIVRQDGVVNLASTLNVSSLAQIRRITSSGGVIEAPEIEENSAGFRAPMRNGEPLVLMSYDGWNSNENKQGIGMPENFFLGGGALGEVKRDTLIVLVTPYVVR